MAQSPLKEIPSSEIGSYLQNWDALGSMITRGRSFSGYERNCCFLNLGSETKGSSINFADISAASGLNLIDDTRAIIATDWDHDGDLDLWVTNREGPRVRLLRNNLEQDQRSGSVSLHLKGTTCNLDAIGAKLTLIMGPKRMTRALRAGDGFLSQSSKRILFGMKKNISEKGTLEVIWPGGQKETFEDIVQGSVYRIVQGSGKAQKITKKERKINLQESRPEPQSQTEQARIILTQRVKAPLIEYVDFNGNLKQYDPDQDNNSPSLINLWASWCGPCVAELSEFKKYYSQIQSKELQIIALTTEFITENDSKPDLEKAKELIKKNNYPFKVGVTDAKSLRLLTLLNNQLFSRERPLPLPSSFLLDKHGNLAIIYRGPVSTDQLIKDINLLNASPRAVSEASFPFKSNDGSELFKIGPLDFAKAYQEGGYFEEALLEAQKITNEESNGKVDSSPISKAKAWIFIAAQEQSQRNWEPATVAYQKAIDLLPNQPLLKIQSGVVLWMAEKHDEANALFKGVAEAGSDNPVILDTLGKAHQQIGREQEAINFYEKAIALKPEHAPYQINLAIAHQRNNAPSEAVKIYREIIANNEPALNAKNNLAWILATDPDEGIRDAKSALELSEEVNQRTGYTNFATLDTLAAAQAENGQFAKAVMTINKAIKNARATGKLKTLDKLQEKAQLYSSKSPFRSHKK
ncbi:MAG: ASPIC/UnbV domain-containing protein [Verrucomicrobiales bacterium]|nr:ASPIC/UnbV domain-containing protein [Verrucomicrobiales bacterium]